MMTSTLRLTFLQSLSPSSTFHNKDCFSLEYIPIRIHSPISVTLISSSLEMASFSFLLLLIISFMASPLLSLATRQNSGIPIISASPSSNPLQSPFQELSPDIAPLLPTPGGAVPTAGSSIPTIPSSPSPPNPDDFSILGPDSAFPPSASFPVSSSAPECSVRSLNLAAFVLVLAYCSRLIV